MYYYKHLHYKIILIHKFCKYISFNRIIRSNNLNSIPDSISNFKDLEYLYEQDNLIFYIIYNISNKKNYILLFIISDLYNNEIQNIPSGIENLRNLKYLYVIYI